jgi:hypothetical protein
MNKNKELILLFSCVALLCFMTSASADVGGSNQVTIYVRAVTSGPFIADESVIESPVEGAIINIYENNVLIYNDTTDEQGIIEVNLEDGIYRFTADAQGYSLKETEQSITESTTITLFLTPPISMMYYAFIFVIIIIVGIFVFVSYKNKKRKKRKHGKKV